MQEIQQKVQDIVRPLDLLTHPFYVSWSAGTLPAEKLKVYANEYGTFIRMISELWETAGYPEIAAEEREHTEVWQSFAQSLKTEIASAARISEIAALTAFMRRATENRAVALGALLAFEFQQPATVDSKLRGLRTHYANLKADETYFEIHLDDWEEPRLLVSEIAKLTGTDREVALEALKQACSLLWNALTGVHAMPEAA